VAVASRSPADSIMDVSCMSDLTMALLSIGQFDEKTGLLVTVRYGSLPNAEYTTW
jgi:hypothetical protein